MVRDTGKYKMDMCTGALLPKILMFTFPLMFSSILQLLFNAADIVVVGKFAGDTALAAVGCTSSLINLITNLFIGLSVGANVLAARFFAAKREDELSATVHTSILVSVVCGVVLAVVGCFGAYTFLSWMGTPENVHALATTYLRIYFLGMPAMMLYNYGASILRAVGDTRRPLYYLLFAGVINVLLNLFFVIVLKLSVAGVALATVISQCVSAFLVIRCLMGERDGLRLEINKLRIDPGKLKQLIQIGLPAGVQGVLFSLSNVIIQASVNSFGDTIIAGNSAAANIEGFVWVSMNAFSQASMAFTSQNYGAGKQERINKTLWVSELCVIVTGVVLGNLVVLLAGPLLYIYTDSADVVAAGVDRLNVICKTYALCGMMDVCVGALRGIGYSIMPTIVTLIGVCGLRLIWIFTAFQTPRFHTTTWLFITYPASWFITFVVLLIVFIIIRRRQLRGGIG
ncbi:MAG: MATE family efflux transporter [Lachnospiraceae bacterium]|nr:MATE family efflux transporter [Lachnospiraceae bacterium]